MPSLLNLGEGVKYGFTFRRIQCIFVQFLDEHAGVYP